MYVTLLNKVIVINGQFLTDSSRRRDLMRARYRVLGFTESEVRGMELLRHCLWAEQLAQFNKYGYFEVTGCKTGKRYRIRYGTATNIHELGWFVHFTAGWCFVPNQHWVRGDIMLGHKIALETEELSALVVARPFRP